MTEGPSQSSSVDRLLALIEQAAGGGVAPEAFVHELRQAHEAVERAGRPAYRSKAEARLIWDMLWAIEFYSPDPSRELNPDEWNDGAAILAEARRVAGRLQEL